MRSRTRIAVDALLPVLILAWLMLVLPVGVGLIQTGVAPTAASLTLPAMAMVVSAAHVVIGFAVGLVVPRLIAAPVLAVGVFFTVASSWSSGTSFWPRHLSGQYPTGLDFGELPTLASLVPHVLFAGSIATGLVLLLLLRQMALRLLLAIAVIVAGTVTSYAMVDSWGPHPELSTHNAPVTCTGNQPRICMPRGTAKRAPEVRRQAVVVMGRLSKAGVKVQEPRTITDTVLNGRFGRASTRETWQLPLTHAIDRQALRYAVTREAVGIPCKHPEQGAAQRLMLWASAVSGAPRAGLHRQQEEVFSEAAKQRLSRSRAQVTEVRTRSASQQAGWYRETARHACRGTASGEH
ncbi:MAG: DUF7224 domain-containing protein [Streptomyces sp.]|uniref:DUF7224 domain-containing protein n=1 Tax=Streptomyces sp. TaxID=1931 RepID=UPI003D6BE190